MTSFTYRKKIMQDERGFLTVEQVNSIISNAGSDRNKVLLMTLAMTGRRISEALLLKPKDINYESEQIDWLILKKRPPERQWIRTNRGLLLALKTYIIKYNIKPDEYVFRSCQQKNRPIIRSRAHQILRNAGEKAGIKNIGESKLHCHILRHSFAIWAVRQIKSAADLRKLQILLGHSSIDMTAQYLQYSQKDLEDIVNNLPDFMKLGLSDEETKEELKKKVEDNGLDITTIGEGINTKME